MPLFEYAALGDDGRRRRGTIESPNKELALNKLREEGLTPLVVDPVKEAKNVEDILARFRDVPKTALVYFSRQLATMIDSGIAPLRALTVMEEQEENVKFKEVLGDVITRVESGEELWRAFKEHPTVFEPLYSSMVRAGEESGNLANALKELAVAMEKQQRMRRAVKSATAYPKVVGIACFFIISGLLMTIVPRFAAIFEETVRSTQAPDADGNLPDASLPGLTQFVVNVSHILYPEGDKGSIGYWFMGIGDGGVNVGVLPRLIMLLVVAYIVRRITRNVLLKPGPRAKWDSFKLNAPMRIGPLIQKIAVARFSRTFASLLRAGVPAQDAMEIVADTAGNVLIANAVMEARDRMLAGSTIAEPLARSAVFPTMVTRMVEVGEETGQLELMLIKVAEFFEEEVEAAIKSLTSIIEPLLIFVVGAAIGVIIIAIYLPMFKLYDLIGTGTVLSYWFVNKFSLQIARFRGLTETCD